MSKPGKVLKKEKLLVDAGLRTCAQTLEGRAFLWDILRKSGAIGQNAFAGSDRETAFNCGQQNVGQRVLAHILEVDHTIYLQMMKENANDWNPLDNPGADSDPGAQLDFFGPATDSGARADARDSDPGPRAESYL